MLESILTSTVRFSCRVIINLLFKSNDKSFSFLGILHILLGHVIQIVFTAVLMTQNIHVWRRIIVQRIANGK